MSKLSPFRYFKTSPEIIRLAVMLYVRFPLSLRNVEDLLHERGIDVSHETIRFWWNRFGPMFAAEIRRKRASRLRASEQWRWHLDEVFVKIRGEPLYLWRGSCQIKSLVLADPIWKGVGMSKLSPFRYFKTSPEIIRLAVMLYVRFPLSLRNVEDLLHERGIDVSHETIRFWWNRFGPMFAAEIRRKRASRLRASQQWRWHLDEVFVKIRGETHYLWRAVDHEGEVLESVVTKTKDRRAAVRFLKKLMRRYGKPKQLVTDRLRAYGAALKQLGLVDERECSRHANNRAENSHLPFRRRERAMLRFRRMRSLQKFVAVHAAVINHFNLDRSLTKRAYFKSNRTAALQEWRQVCAG